MHSCLFSLDVFIGGSPGALCLLMLSPPYCHSLTPLMSAKVIVKTNSRDNLTHSHPINLYSEYFAFYRLYKTPTNLYSITVYHHFTPLQDYFHYDLGTEWEDNQIISHKWSDQNVLRVTVNFKYFYFALRKRSSWKGSLHSTMAFKCFQMTLKQSLTHLYFEKGMANHITFHLINTWCLFHFNHSEGVKLMLCIFPLDLFNTTPFNMGLHQP